MNIKYKEAIEEDREFFVHVHHTAYRTIIEKMFGWDEKRQDHHANRAFDDGGINILWKDDKRIGVVGWEEREDYFWVKQFFILPEYQARGMGSQILKDIITKARSLAKELRLRTLKANLRAKEIYERHGFETVDSSDIHWNMIRPFTMPEFKTQRLLLKPVTLKDVEAYKKHFIDYEIIRNLSSGVPWPYPDDGVESFLNTLIFPYQGESEWLWGLFLQDGHPDELIGAVHLWRASKPENRGFWLSREYQGKGLMTEAVEPIMDYAFTELAFKKLVFANATANKKSRRIKEKTGARLLRVESAKCVDPALTQQEIWELEAQEWFVYKKRELSSSSSSSPHCSADPS